MFKNQQFSKTNFLAGLNSKVKDLEKSGYKTHEEAIELLLTCRGVYWSTWNIDDISFPVGYLYEDMGTTYKTILKAHCIFFINKVLYYYCKRKGNITNLRTKDVLHDKFLMEMQQYRGLEEWGYSPKKLDLILLNIAMNYCIGRKRDFSDEGYAFCSSILKSCKKFRDHLPGNVSCCFYFLIITNLCLNWYVRFLGKSMRLEFITA